MLCDVAGLEVLGVMYGYVPLLVPHSMLLVTLTRLVHAMVRLEYVGVTVGPVAMSGIGGLRVGGKESKLLPHENKSVATKTAPIIVIRSLVTVFMAGSSY